MKIIDNRNDLIAEIKKIKKQDKTIGFVPTMGFLHEGHLSLMRESKKNTDVTISSIFVNPAQFNDPNDYEKYPKNIESDSKLCESVGVDILYIPTIKDIYPNGIPKIEIKIPHLTKNLCGKSRPGHFEGILLIIANLFHLIPADKCFFGKKDYQQYLVIKEFVKNLSFPMEIIGMDTVREKDGLAMSSRNARLNEKERDSATLLIRSLKMAKSTIEKKEKNANVIKEIMSEVIMTSPLTKIDYIEIVDKDTLKPLKIIDKPVLIALAVFVGEVRLIDNMIV